MITVVIAGLFGATLGLPSGNRRVQNFGLDFLDNYLPQSVSRLTRPLYNVGEDFASGLTNGFLNVDLDMPLYCVTDGLQTALGAFELYKVYQKDKNPDVYANLYDVLITL